jgi:ferritin
MGLISEKLNNQLNELTGKSFSLNRLVDRGVSLLDVRWNLLKTSDNVHHRIAHAFPGDDFADSITYYQAQRNCESIYPATPAGDKNYENPKEFFDDLYAQIVEYENMIKDAVEEAVDEGDQTTKVFLDGLLSRLTPYVDLAQNLIDLITAYGDNSFHLQVFDSVIEDYMEDYKAY